MTKQKEVLIRLDQKTDRSLEKLAALEHRTKVGELRFLIKSRIDVLEQI